MSSSKVGHDFSEASYELPETKFAKELKDEIRELTEEEHEEMSGWLEDYFLTDLKEKMKHKATEVREKRTRKTVKGKSKVEFHKTLSGGGVAGSQQKKIKNQEKDAQPEKIKRKIDFSDLRIPQKKFYAAVWRGHKI